MVQKDFKVKFWGVRGSYPVCSKDFLKYGGNTSCVEITAGCQHIILDCGSGMISLGDKLYKDYLSSGENISDRTPISVTVLLSHVHQDHIQGLNFFKPVNIATTKLSLFGYSGIDSCLDDTLSELIYGKSFPINIYDNTADFLIRDINESEIIKFDKDSKMPYVERISNSSDFNSKNNEVVISFLKSNSHPNYGVMCFKISYKGKTLVYATDTECYQGGAKRLELFAKDADLLIHDSQYTTEDYLSPVIPKQGFGHSTFDMAFDTAVNANVKKLAFFHFDPSYNDDKLTFIENSFKSKNKNYFLAKEGMEICI